MVITYHTHTCQVGRARDSNCPRYDRTYPAAQLEQPLDEGIALPPERPEGAITTKGPEDRKR